MQEEKPRVSIIIPAYNEEKRIGNRLQILTEYFSKVMIGYELLVAMDGCTDRTPQIVSLYMKKNNHVKSIYSPKRLGKGGALIEAFRSAEGDIFLITDADNSTSPKALLKLAKEAEYHDLVIGSRYVKSAKLPMGVPFVRFFLGRSFNAIMKLMFWRLRKINDTQCGAKAIRRSVLEKIKEDLFITGFAIDVNLVYSAMRKGFRVKEVGIAWTHIEHGSKVSNALVKLIIGMSFSLVKLRLYYSRFRPLLNTMIIKKFSTFIWNLTKA